MPSEPCTCSARGDVMERLRDGRIHRGNVFANLVVVLVLVAKPRRAEDEQAKLFKFNPRIRDLLLNHLLPRKLLALGFAGNGALAEMIEHAPGLSDRAHGVMQPPSAESRLGNDK